MLSATLRRVARPNARHVLHAIALVIGAVALAILIDRLGREGFERVILGTGRWFLVIAAIDLEDRNQLLLGNTENLIECVMARKQNRKPVYRDMPRRDILNYDPGEPPKY